MRRAAERFQVSHTTAARWATRYREPGVAGMSDRSRRPHHQPRRTAATVEEQVLRPWREHRIGPLRPAARCGIGLSPAHRILVRHGLPPLASLDRATGEPVRRYERARPGEPLLDLHEYALGTVCAAVPIRTGTDPECVAPSLPTPDPLKLAQAARVLRNEAIAVVLALLVGGSDPPPPIAPNIPCVVIPR